MMLAVNSSWFSTMSPLEQHATQSELADLPLSPRVHAGQLRHEGLPLGTRLCPAYQEVVNVDSYDSDHFAGVFVIHHEHTRVKLMLTKSQLDETCRHIFTN